VARLAAGFEFHSFKGQVPLLPKTDIPAVSSGGTGRWPALRSDSFLFFF